MARLTAAEKKRRAAAKTGWETRRAREREEEARKAKARARAKARREEAKRAEAERLEREKERLAKRRERARAKREEAAAEEERKRRERAARKRKTERAHEKVLAPLLNRFLEMREQGASPAVIKAAHETWYSGKSDTRDILGEGAYERILRRIGAAAGLDDVQPYIDS